MTLGRVIVVEGMIGADPQSLRDLAKIMANSSTSVDQTATTLSATIQATRWNGDDAARFKSSWARTLQPTVSAAAKLLNDTSNKLIQQAAEQEKASNGYESGAGGGGAGGGDVKSDGPLSTAQQDELRNQVVGLGQMNPDEQANWWNNLSDAERQFVLSGEKDGIPLAQYLAEQKATIPVDAFDQAEKSLVDQGRESIPIFKQSTQIGVDGHVAWIHGGAHVGTDIVQNADGKATLKVWGDLSVGANVPGNKETGVTLSGEASREYEFKSLADARAAQANMLANLPPDGFGDAKNAVDNPAGYILGKLDAAAHDAGSTKTTDALKGTFELSAGGKLGENASGSVSAAMAYEAKSDNTSTASGTFGMKGDLDLGDGMKLSGSGEVGVQVDMNSNHDVTKLTLDVQGSVQGHMGADSTLPFGPDKDLKGYDNQSATSSVGVQASAKIEVYNTPENQSIMQSYLNNYASGNQAAAAQDLSKLYNAGAVTLQTDATSSQEYNWVDADIKVASLKVGGSSEQITNLTTGYKPPYGSGYVTIQPDVPVNH